MNTHHPSPDALLAERSAEKEAASRAVRNRVDDYLRGAVIAIRAVLEGEAQGIPCCVAAAAQLRALGIPPEPVQTPAPPPSPVPAAPPPASAPVQPVAETKPNV